MVISQIDPQNFQASITYPVTLSPVFEGFIGGSESQIKTIWECYIIAAKLRTTFNIKQALPLSDNTEEGSLIL